MFEIQRKGLVLVELALVLLVCGGMFLAWYTMYNKMTSPQNAIITEDTDVLIDGTFEVLKETSIFSMNEFGIFTWLILLIIGIVFFILLIYLFTNQRIAEIPQNSTIDSMPKDEITNLKINSLDEHAVSIKGKRKIHV